MSPCFELLPSFSCLLVGPLYLKQIMLVYTVDGTVKWTETLRIHFHRPASCHNCSLDKCAMIVDCSSFCNIHKLYGSHSVKGTVFFLYLVGIDVS
jgi:hypothetical protein